VIRSQANQETDELFAQYDQQSLLSQAEHSVLSVFRRYLMTPGKMLCISGSQLDDFDVPLTQLSDRGLLVAESYHGGYSLTRAGFSAMKDGA
jgi:hypothetical protein